MLSLKHYAKFRLCFAFKFLTLLFISILVFNLFLYYNLKSIGYLQSTVHVLQNGRTFLEPTKNNTENILHKDASEKVCKTGNYSVLISDILLQLKEDLDEFYLTSPKSTHLYQRCHKFLRKVASRLWNSIQVNGSIDFGSKIFVQILKNSAILKIENAPKGTQLKLLAHLRDNTAAIVKPKWYSPYDIITGPVYAGKDRHYGEVIAFYLSILLDMPRVPPAVTRTFDLSREIINVADEKLRRTFEFKGNKTCFYGVCPYCNPNDLLCTDSKYLEGAVIYYLSSQHELKLMKHPWRRTYRCNILARWETDENYCNVVKNSKFFSNERNKNLFLDFIDVAIFDFLISNGDRHHCEYLEKAVNPRILILDNGKSFGNPYVDHVDILAPLYQCCVLRNATWNNLLELRGGNLSKWLQYLLSNSDSNIIVNKMHYAALDRRILLTFASIQYCFNKKGIRNVIIDENGHV